MRSGEPSTAQLILGAVEAEDMDAVIERTFLDFDAYYVIVSAVDALHEPLFAFPSSPQARDLLISLAGIRDQLGRTPDPDISAALSTAIAILTSAKASNSEALVAQAYFCLALCYTALPFEDDSDRQEENQFSAIQCLKQSLAYAARTNNTSAFTLVQSFLGEVYLRMPRGSEEEAKFHLGYAVKYFRPLIESPPPGVSGDALSRNHLGIGLSDLLLPARLPGSRLSSVLEHCSHAITDSVSRPQSALRRTLKHTLIGMEYYRYMLTRDKSALRQSANHLDEALNTLPREGFQRLRCRLATNLGNVWMCLEEWTNAHSAYRLALDWSPDARGLANPFRLERDSELTRNCAFCEAILGNPDVSLRTANTGRATMIQRGFLEQLAASSGSAAEESSYQDARLALRRTQAMFAGSRPASGSLLAEIAHDGLPVIQLFEHGAAEGSRAPEAAGEYLGIARELRDTAQNMSALMDELSHHLPVLGNLPLSANWSIAGMIDADQAVIVPITTPSGTAVILATAKGLSTVLLRELTSHNLRAFVGQGWPKSFGFGPSMRDQISFGYLGAYHSRDELDDQWTIGLDETLRVIGEAFWAHILPHLAETITNIVVIPNGLLSILPMAAAYIGGSGDKKRPVLADRAVSCLPSLGCLALAKMSASRREERSLCCVVNPERDAALEGTKLEADAIRRLFVRSVTLVGRQATRAAVLRGTSGFSYIHIASHAFYDWQNVGRSGLRMSDAAITVNDIWSGIWDLRNARLVVLSACETGMIDVYSEASSEMPGLPGALLLAGVPGVVGTLWPVDDLATALVMSRFYEEHIVEGHGISDALRHAQNWLRQVTLIEVELTAAALGQRIVKRAKLLRANVSNDRRSKEPVGDIQPFQAPLFWAPYVCFGQ
jgi:CHAT domain-containing protein